MFFLLLIYKCAISNSTQHRFKFKAKGLTMKNDHAAFLILFAEQSHNPVLFIS